MKERKKVEWWERIQAKQQLKGRALFDTMTMNKMDKRIRGFVLLFFNFCWCFCLDICMYVIPALLREK